MFTDIRRICAGASRNPKEIHAIGKKKKKRKKFGSSKTLV